MLLQYTYGTKYRSELLAKLDSNESAGFHMQDIPDYKSSKKTLTEYPDIVERPLFFKVRRPIIPPTSTEDEAIMPTVSKNYKFILTGIIRTPNDVYCLLQNSQAKQNDERFFRMKEGDEIDGRVVDEIKSDRIIMLVDGVSEELLLMKPRSKAPIPPKKQVKPKVKPRKKARNSRDRSNKKNTKDLNPFVEKPRTKYIMPPETNSGSERLNPFNLENRL